MRFTARLKPSLVLPIVLLMLGFWVVALRMETIVASEQIRYFNDSVNDSTRPEEFPWGEIREVWVENDTITIRSNGIMHSGEGYLLLFFDENFDNITDVILRYNKAYTETRRDLVGYCYLCRPSNHSYYHHDAWNYAKDQFDAKTEENVTLGRITFHLGEAMKGELRLKIISYYIYDRGGRLTATPHKIGGDTVPNCPWEIDELTNPAYLENLAKIVNDTRFPYPTETFLLEEPELPPPPPPTIIDLVYGLFSSVQNWVTDNVATTVLLSIFSFATIYSIFSRIRAFINVSFAYFIITGLIYATTLQTSSFMPFFLSTALLVPLFLWYRETSASLSSILNVQKRLAWIEVLALFLFTLAIRLYVTISAISLPLEAPLVYLVILTIVLIKGNTLDIYGFKMKSFAKSLLIGLAYCLTYGLPFFATFSGLIFVFTGQLAFSVYNVFTALVYFPFMTLCVGVSEEGLFRGFMQTRLAKVYSKNTALLVQALLFGAWQLVIFVSPLNVIGMIVYISQTFAFGLISGLFYKKSGNLIPLILTNGLMNTTILFAANRFEIYETEPLFSIILGVSISIGLIVQVIFTKYLANRARVETEMNTQEGV